MAKISRWTEDYWLLVLQLYQQKPKGVKPLYSKAVVDLSLELHLPPRFIYRRMCQLRDGRSVLLEQLMETYSKDSRKLKSAVERLRRMSGFNHPETFYRDVEVSETFEKDFKVIGGQEPLMPVHLMMILDLYFRLTPVTMVAETPEVKDLARLLGLKAGKVAEVLVLFQYCDPYLRRQGAPQHALMAACQDVWSRFSAGTPAGLEALTQQLAAYFE